MFTVYSVMAYAYSLVDPYPTLSSGSYSKKCLQVSSREELIRTRYLSARQHKLLELASLGERTLAEHWK